MDHAETCKSGVNDARTGGKIDTPLTQRRSRRVRNKRLTSLFTKMVHGKVYFARAGNAIKIGFSMDPEGRVYSLQTASAEPMEVLGIIDGTERTERDLHRKFRYLHMRGEWFKADESLLGHIRKLTGQPEPEPALPPPVVRRPPSPEIKAMISKLTAARPHCSEQQRWHVSNLIEQLRNYDAATDPMVRAGLAKFMAKSVARIEALADHQ